MATVGAGFSMSLDGFVADEKDDPSLVFAWYFASTTDVTDKSIDELAADYVPEAEALQEQRAQEFGAVISGRRTFDTASAWNGKHPLDVPVVVLTHNPPAEWPSDGKPFTFVTEGIERAVEVATQIAGDRTVGVTGPDVMRQCLKLGLLDEIGIDLVPVLLGKGVPMFEYLGIEPLHLEKTGAKNGPAGVTHLRYRIKK
jgi:dihydrofolate reductase